MKKSIVTLLVLSSFLSATTFVCTGNNNTSAIIETDGDYGITLQMDGKKYDGVWKGSTTDEDGKPVKLHYLYGNDNIWIHSQNRFQKTTIRFHHGMDNMYLRYLECKPK